MKFSKVIGTAVASQKTGNTDGLRLLVCEELDESLKDTGKTCVAVDTMGAGTGDIVLTCTSSSARCTKITADVCTDTSIVAIVSSVGDRVITEQG